MAVDEHVYDEVDNEADLQRNYAAIRNEIAQATTREELTKLPPRGVPDHAHLLPGLAEEVWRGGREIAPGSSIRVHRNGTRSQRTRSRDRHRGQLRRNLGWRMKRGT
jgi:hypothetical protein